MPYGKYQGKPMSAVPADYLLWLHENGKCSPLVAEYIREHMSQLRKEAEEAERAKEKRRVMRRMYR